jgi:RecA-family ATPase
MSDIGQIEKVVIGLQEALAFLRAEVAKTQTANKKASDTERRAEETLALARQKISECTHKEVVYQKQHEDLVARENKIRRYEDFEAQVVSLDRDRATLNNDRAAFTVEVRRKREESNAKAEDLLLARRELDQQKAQLEKDRANMRKEIIQFISKEST